MSWLDRLRGREDDRPVPEDVKAQTEAVDALLRGGEAPPGSEGLEDLVRDLRAERETPDPGYAARLDEWAGEGFARDRRPERANRPSRSAPGWLTPRRLAPAGALAAGIVVAVIAVSQNPGEDDSGTAGTLDAKEAPSAVPAEAGDSGAGAQDSATPPTATALEAAPDAAPRRAAPSRITLLVPPRGIPVARDEAIAIAVAAGGSEVAGRSSGDGVTLTVPAEELGEVLDELREIGGFAGVAKVDPPAAATEATVEVVFESG